MKVRNEMAAAEQEALVEYNHLQQCLERTMAASTRATRRCSSGTLVDRTPEMDKLLANKSEELPAALEQQSKLVTPADLPASCSTSQRGSDTRALGYQANAAVSNFQVETASNMDFNETLSPDKLDSPAALIQLLSADRLMQLLSEMTAHSVKVSRRHPVCQPPLLRRGLQQAVAHGRGGRKAAHEVVS